MKYAVPLNATKMCQQVVCNNSTWFFDTLKGSELTCKEDFSTTDGFSRSCPGALHERPLLRQQQVVLCFIN